MQFCLEVTKCNTSSHCSFWTWRSFLSLESNANVSLCIWLGCTPFRQNCFPLSFGFIYLFFRFRLKKFWVSVRGVFFFCAATVAVLITLTTQLFLIHLLFLSAAVASVHMKHIMSSKDRDLVLGKNSCACCLDLQLRVDSLFVTPWTFMCLPSTSNDANTCLCTLFPFRQNLRDPLIF